MSRKKKKKSVLVFTFRFLILLIPACLLLWFLYIYSGRVLCRIALKQIASLTGTRIESKSVVFNPRGSIIIEDLVISPLVNQVADVSILNAQRVYVQFNPGSLFLLKPRLQVIDVNDFIFNAQYDVDSGWSNLTSLKFKPPGRGSFRTLPQIHLRDGVLQYSKIVDGKEQVAASIPVDANFGPDELREDGYTFEVKTSTLSSGFGASRLTGNWKPGIVTIAGGLSSLDIPELEMAWLIDVLAAELKYEPSGEFSLALRVTDLQSKRSETLERFALFGPAFLAKSSVYTFIHRFFQRYDPKGRIDIELAAAGNFNHLSESTLEGAVLCKDAAICCVYLPYAVENLTGRIDFTQNSVTLNNIHGKHGDTKLLLNGWSRNFGQNQQYNIDILSDNMALDSDIYNALDDKQKRFWSYLQPGGYTMMDLQISRFSPTDKRMNLLLELQDVNAIYSKFPYPLENLTGQVAINKNSVVFSNVVSRQNQHSIIINGRVTNDANIPAYDLSIDVNNIPLNATLENILPEKQKRFYEQIHPSGLAKGQIKARTDETEQKVKIDADLTFRDTSLHLNQLSQPVTDISAQAYFAEDLININNLSGKYDSSQVSMKGQFRSEDENDVSYDISVSLEQMQMSDDLLGFLPDSTKSMIRRLEPGGLFDINADITGTSAEIPDYEIMVNCLGNTITLPRFPYPLKDVRGSLLIDGNGVEIEDITALTGAVSQNDANLGTISLTGKMILKNSDFNNASLNLTAKNVPFDENLKDFIPLNMQKGFEKLSPRGRFDMNSGKVILYGSGDGLKTLGFDGQIVIKDCGLNLINPDTKLNIIITTEWAYENNLGLFVDTAYITNGTLSILGKTFTGIKAEIRLDSNMKNWSTENLVADCYGGKITGKLELKQPPDEPSEYIVQAFYENVDLKQFLAGVGKQQTSDVGTSGRMSGFFSIQGLPADDKFGIGQCNFNITNMKAGKTSILGKLLNVVNLTEPSDYVFNNMFVDSYINNNELLVRKIDLNGGSASFSGSGRMDISSRNIDLILTARGKRLATAEPSALQSLTEGLGQAVVRIDITGKLDNPIVTTKTLPVIESTLQILGTKPPATN
jgi:hypothetical protein